MVVCVEVVPLIVTLVGYLLSNFLITKVSIIKYNSVPILDTELLFMLMMLYKLSDKMICGGLEIGIQVLYSL